MLAPEVVGGLLLFIPLFVGAGAAAAKLSARHHTGLAILSLFAGLGVALAVVVEYGKAVR